MNKVLSVIQNGAEVGEISKYDYDELVKEVDSNKLIPLMQVTNIADTFIKFLYSFVKEALLIFALFFIWILVSSPESFAELLSVPENERVLFATTLREFCFYACCFSAITHGIRFIVYQDSYLKSLGFKNVRKQILNKKLAKIVESNVTSDIYVVPVNRNE